MDTITIGFVLAMIAIITVYDVWTLVRRGYSTTISWQTLVWSRQWPIIPLLMGILAGHLWFPNRAGRLDCPPAAQQEQP